MPKELTARDNLTAQLDAIKRHANMNSYGSRNRYYDASKRFCDFAADTFKLQKFANVQGKHIRAYVDYMEEKGLAPSTMRTELSGIRYFYDFSGGKNVLPDEISSAAGRANELNRPDAEIAVNLTSQFGLRIEECAKVRTEDITNALRYGELHVNGKGGQERNVPVETKEQKALLIRLRDYAKLHNLQPGDYLISRRGKYGVQREIMSLKNWMTNSRKEFTDPNRTEKVKPGEKPRTSHISWHGLRYYYAQETYKRLKEQGVKDVDRQVSERLGYHRKDVTRIYLDDQNEGGMITHIKKEDCFLKQKATLKELRERFDDKPTSKSAYTVDGIAYTVVSHYAGEKDIDEVIEKITVERAYTDMSLPKTQQN